MSEAKLERTEHGLVRREEGWFTVNLAEAQWKRNAWFGAWCDFEGDVRFPELGVNVTLIWPGQANCRYHHENMQEDFLVLQGECLLLVEGRERRLRAWDFVHCPEGTAHVFVGAGDGPCAILMMGTRKGQDARFFYPVEPVAVKHGAASAEPTPDPKVAYAGMPPSVPCPSMWPPSPGAPRPE